MAPAAVTLNVQYRFARATLHMMMMMMMMMGFRGLGMTDDVDVRITHLDSRSYVEGGKSVEVLFEDCHIKPKRAVYEEACRLLGHRFVPFVVSTDGVLSAPAREFVQLLANKTAEKWGMEGPGQKGVVMALIRAKIGAAIVRGASWCVRGDREGRNKYVEGRGVQVDGANRAELRFLFSSQASYLPA